MTIKEKTDIRNYCLWLCDKISGILLVKRDCETYLLVGETEKVKESHLKRNKRKMRTSKTERNDYCNGILCQSRETV